MKKWVNNVKKDKGPLHPEILDALSDFYYQDSTEALKGLKGIWAREAFSKEGYWCPEIELIGNNLKILKRLKSESPKFSKFLKGVRSSIDSEEFKFKDILSSFEDMLG